jgi:hypothetical protein
MPASWNAKHPKPLTPFWQTTVKVALLATLIGLFFLLADSMVEHRFFQGGWVDNRGTIR